MREQSLLVINKRLKDIRYESYKLNWSMDVKRLYDNYFIAKLR